MELASKLYKQKKHKIVNCLLLDFTYLLKNNLNVILLKFCTELTREELIFTYKALAVVGFKWDGYYYYVVATLYKDDNVLDIIEFMDDFVEFSFIYDELEQGLEILNHVTVLKSNPPLFIRTVNFFNLKLNLNETEVWFFIQKEKLSIMLTELKTEVIDFNDIKFILEYFKNE